MVEGKIQERYQFLAIWTLLVRVAESTQSIKMSTSKRAGPALPGPQIFLCHSLHRARRAADAAKRRSPPTEIEIPEAFLNSDIPVFNNVPHCRACNRCDKLYAIFCGVREDDRQSWRQLVNEKSSTTSSSVHLLVSENPFSAMLCHLPYPALLFRDLWGVGLCYRADNPLTGRPDRSLLQKMPRLSAGRVESSAAC